MASRASDFSSTVLQCLSRPLSELGERADLWSRPEICDLLIVLAGHLFASNFNNRWIARQALESAVFGLKARIAGAEKSQKLDGYAGGARAYVSMVLRWPGIEAGKDLMEEMKLLELARSLPWEIHRAFPVSNPSPKNGAYFGGMNVKLSDRAKATFDQAKENAAKSANALIDAALGDSDGLLGAYLAGLPSVRGEEGRWIVPAQTLVEKLMRERTNVFRAAEMNCAAINAVLDAGAIDPVQRNMARTLEIGWAILRYAFQHDRRFPDSIEMLFEKEDLKPPVTPRSLITGRPYVYVGADEKQPAKLCDAAEMVLLDDDRECQGWYQCFSAVGAGVSMRVDELREQLRRRGK